MCNKLHNVSLFFSHRIRGIWQVRVLDKEVSQALLLGLYKFADCFVLPSRGDGWGRPIVEAMAMELPVIATQWSGMIEYMSELNSYPLQKGDMSEIVQGPFSGHFWADPSQSRLMKLMRRVVQNPGEGNQKGRRARQDLVEQYSPEVVADVVLEQLLRIQRQLDLRDVESAYSLVTWGIWSFIIFNSCGLIQNSLVVWGFGFS